MGRRECGDGGGRWEWGDGGGGVDGSGEMGVPRWESLDGSGPMGVGIRPTPIEALPYLYKYVNIYIFCLYTVYRYT